MTSDILIDELLERGADDWVMAAQVAWIARSVGGASTDAEELEVSIDLMRAVLTAGLMEVGDVTDGGFFEWRLSVADAMQRIEEAWRGLGRSPSLGEVCWLSNTATGDARAQGILARRGR